MITPANKAPQKGKSWVLWIPQIANSSQFTSKSPPNPAAQSIIRW
jgi:hypothetical protein